MTIVNYYQYEERSVVTAFLPQSFFHNTTLLLRPPSLSIYIYYISENVHVAHHPFSASTLVAHRLFLSLWLIRYIAPLRFLAGELCLTGHRRGTPNETPLARVSSDRVARYWRQMTLQKNAYVRIRIGGPLVENQGMWTTALCHVSFTENTNNFSTHISHDEHPFLSRCHAFYGVNVGFTPVRKYCRMNRFLWRES